MSDKFVNYYALLSVDKSASTDQIRTAYKKESLRTHPDRLPPTASPEQRRSATERFQAVADAYYVLSDPVRRRDYDALLSSRTRGADPWAGTSSAPGASANFFQQFASAFASGAGAPRNAEPEKEWDEDAEEEYEPEEAGPDPTSRAWSGERPSADQTFSNVFEELLRPEVQRVIPWWTYIGAASGAGLGYIVANIPGALMGGYAGNRLGAIRDAKGKSVAEVFGRLGGSQKAEILKALAMKVLGSAF